MPASRARFLASLSALALACSSNAGDLPDGGDDTDASSTGTGTGSGTDAATDADTDTDTDTDADTDTDTDADADADADSDSDSGSDTDSDSSSDSGSTAESSSTGAPAECGDGILDDPETCDDGNTDSNDGCSSTCAIQRVLQVSTGGWHSCAILDTGALRCWGNGPAHGHPEIPSDVGDDETPAQAGDVAVGGTPTQIVSGWRHSCALLDDGNVRCWGDAPNGELGYGSVSSVLSPEQGGDVEVGGTVTQLASAHYHTCALFDDATVRCWGINLHGQLGQVHTNNIGDDETPASVDPIDIGGDVVQITTGIGHTCALLDGGNVRCWGFGADGALGYGNAEHIGDDETPASAGDVDVGGEVIQISANQYATCALLDGGALRCWGRMEGGALGYGNVETIGNDETPAEVGDIDVGASVEQVSVGAFQICARVEGGSVRCWGYGMWGNLGYGTVDVIGDDEVPATAGDIDLGGPVADLDAQGFGHSCAILESGAVRCWGFGAVGQLGVPLVFPGGIGDNEAPALVDPVEVF